MRLCKFDVKKNRYHPQEYFKAASDRADLESVPQKMASHGVTGCA